MTGYSRLSASTYFWTVLANVVLALALVIPFGIDGVAAATAVALAARGFWLSMALRQHLGVQASVFFAITAAGEHRRPGCAGRRRRARPNSGAS
jgi:O-antigen/teichoic acid export membrane protein